MDKKYNIVVCGGTFDLFHKGHKEFLQFVLAHSKKVVIGFTSDQYIKEYKKDVDIEPYDVRKKAVEEYLTNINELDRVVIISIDDPYGPTVTDEYPFEAVIVTEDTKKGGEKINEIRASKNLSILPVISTELVIGEDGEFISSQRIRDGVINRDGRLYVYEAWFTQTFLLPQALRPEFQKPMGSLIKDFEKWINGNSLDFSKVATVGDIVTSLCNSHNLKQKISIFDFIVERKERFHSYKELGFNLAEEEILSVDNAPGTISGKAFEMLKDIFENHDKPQIMIKVEGEEDLLVLPLILAAPLGFIILYGQPKEGAVKVEVSEEMKERVFNLLSQFERRES